MWAGTNWVPRKSVCPQSEGEDRLDLPTGGPWAPHLPLLASPGVRGLLGLGHHLCVLFDHSRTDGLLAVGTQWSWGLREPDSPPFSREIQNLQSLSVFLHPTALSSHLLLVSRPWERCWGYSCEHPLSPASSGPTEGFFFFFFYPNPISWTWGALLWWSSQLWSHFAAGLAPSHPQYLWGWSVSHSGVAPSVLLILKTP